MLQVINLIMGNSEGQQEIILLLL